jgi:Flp pilus assembly protein TadD
MICSGSIGSAPDHSTAKEFGQQSRIRSLVRRAAIFLALLALAEPWNTAASQHVAESDRTGNHASGDTPDAHLGKGYEALKLDRYEEAASEFRAALALDPKLVERARFPLAVALFEMHKSEEARKELEIVRDAVGDHPNVLYYLGRLDLTDGNLPGAVRNLSKAAVKPPFPDTAYYLGYAYFKQDNLPAAEKWLKEAAVLSPKDSRTQYQLALVYRKGGKDEEAKKAFAVSDQLRQSDTHESRLRMECGQKLDQGSGEDAHAVCEQLYDPDNAEKLTALGTIYGQHGDLEAALKPLRRAAELEPQSPQMQYNLALVYFQMGRFEEARGPLTTALERWPDLFQLNSLYGAVLAKMGEEISAYQALRHAYELNSQDKTTGDLLFLTTLSLGRTASKAKQYSDALKYFEEAARVRPQEPAPHRYIAEVYRTMGRTAEATSEQQQAEQLMKNAGEPK